MYYPPINDEGSIAMKVLPNGHIATVDPMAAWVTRLHVTDPKYPMCYTDTW